MTVTEAPVPACPITGLPAKRRIQWVSSDFLVALWLISFGVSTRRQLRAAKRFGLWEAPCGLAFFDPMIAGDEKFYRAFYEHLGNTGPWTRSLRRRSDYSRAASLITPGAKVPDIGCGTGRFARYVPHAIYVGLDRNIALPEADVRNETLERHAAAHAEEYDVVCAFHVVEHVAEPARFAADLVRCLRPGGRLFLAVPSWNSAITDIPNFAPNGPPHHLSWWSHTALHTLADSIGLTVESVDNVPPSPGLSVIYWMGRMAPKLTGERVFRHAPSSHAGLLWTWLA